ncbi:MAG: alpha/beta fold hydrolase [Myxococcota bacterium]
MSIETHEQRLTTSDGAQTTLRIFAPASPRAVVVFHGGLGIAGGYYEPFGKAMAEAGVALVMLEARGVGSSSIRARRGVDFGYRELLECDLPAAVAAARERFADLPCFVGGHSLGAQVAVLGSAALPDEVAGLVLVAGGSPWWGSYGGAMTLQVQLAGRLFPLTVRLLGWFPGKLFGFGHRESQTFMEEWSSCARSGRYAIEGERDWEAQAVEQAKPVVAVTVQGDDWAPPAAMHELTRRMPHARIDARRVRLSRPGRGRAHFAWARDPDSVVQVVGDWIRRTLDSNR